VATYKDMDVLTLSANAANSVTTVTGTSATAVTFGNAAQSLVNSSSATTTLNATAMTDGTALATSGAGTTVITSLIGDLTDTSTAAQTITVASVANLTVGLGTDTTGTDVIVATALTDGQVLTMTGSNDATVSFVNGDVTATAHVGALTVTGTGTTGQFTTGTVSSSISSSGATAIVATAMGATQTLTTSGAGATTITGLKADLLSTVTAVQDVTLAAVATITLGMGSDTTSDDVVAFTALTDGQVVTMTGASDVTVTSGVADLTATAYTGAISLTTGNGTTVILSGTGADVLTGGTGADAITGGPGADTIKGAVGADVITLTESTAAIDTVILTTGGVQTAITIVGFNVAAAAASGDNVDIDLSDINALTGIANLMTADTENAATTGAPLITAVPSGSAYDMAGAVSHILALAGNIASLDALQTALETGGSHQLIVNDADGSLLANDAILVLWDDGSDSHLSLVKFDADPGNDAKFAADAATAVDLILFTGVTDASTFVSNNFDIIA